MQSWTDESQQPISVLTGPHNDLARMARETVRDKRLEQLLESPEEARRLGYESYRRHKDWVAQRVEDYKRRYARRLENDIRPLCVVGMGRSGKDESAKLIRHAGPRFKDNSEQLGYAGSTSKLIYHLVAEDLQIEPEVAYQDRHQHRVFWYEWCNGFREHDPSLLAKMALADGDLVVGLRDFLELEAVRRYNLADMIYWVDNPRVPVDPTVAFGPEDCDVSIVNGGSRTELLAKWRKQLSLLYPDLEN